MATKKIVAIFDFCDTIFDGQSIGFYLDFLESKLPLHKKIYSKIRKRVNRIPSSDSKKYKEYLLKTFKGLDNSKFELYSSEFFEKVVLNRLHKEVVEKLIEHQKTGHTVLVVSGGFENYLIYFTKKYQVDYLLCTKLKFEDNKFVSKINGNECLGIEKVNRLKEIGLQDYDLKNSFVYSDHHSDKPIFDLVGNKIVVKNIQNIDWIDDGFEIMNVSHA